MPNVRSILSKNMGNWQCFCATASIKCLFCWISPQKAYHFTLSFGRIFTHAVISNIWTFLLSSLLASWRVIGTSPDILVYPAGALFNQAINLISLVAVTKGFIWALVAVIALPVLPSPLSQHRKLPLSSLSGALVTFLALSHGFINKCLLGKKL